jgi:hypothetical protein
MVRIADAEEPYLLGTEVGGCVLDEIVKSVVASRVYRLWGGLTDMYELRPEARRETEALMRRAATEWLAVRDDDAARDKYFDRWLYHVVVTSAPSDEQPRAVCFDRRGAA